MTAINIFVSHDLARVYTDASFLNLEDGKIGAFASKVVMLPQHNAVVAWSGPPDIGFRVWGLIADMNYKSFDEISDNICEQIRLRKDVFINCSICFVGVSERTQAIRAFMISSESPTGAAPFTSLPIQELVMPQPLNKTLLDGRDPIALLQSQRANDSRPDRQQRMHTVGGWIQETSVSRDGIQTRVIHRWPDQVGEVIKP